MRVVDQDVVCVRPAIRAEKSRARAQNKQRKRKEEKANEPKNNFRWLKNMRSRAPEQLDRPDRPRASTRKSNGVAQCFILGPRVEPRQCVRLSVHRAVMIWTCVLVPSSGTSYACPRRYLRKAQMFVSSSGRHRESRNHSRYPSTCDTGRQQSTPEEAFLLQVS